MAIITDVEKLRPELKGVSDAELERRIGNMLCLDNEYTPCKGTVSGRQRISYDLRRGKPRAPPSQPFA